MENNIWDRSDHTAGSAHGSVSWLHRLLLCSDLSPTYGVVLEARSGSKRRLKKFGCPCSMIVFHNASNLKGWFDELQNTNAIVWTCRTPRISTTRKILAFLILMNSNTLYLDCASKRFKCLYNYYKVLYLRIVTIVLQTSSSGKTACLTQQVSSKQREYSNRGLPDASLSCCAKPTLTLWN